MQTYTEGVFYNVDYMHQQHVNLCTDTCVQMLYKAGDRPFASLSKNPRGAFEGLDYTELNGLTKANIIMSMPSEAAAKREDRVASELKQKLEKSGPFILNIGLRGNFQHSVLVTGISNGNIIYNDPLTGPNRVLSIEQIISLRGRHDAPYFELATANFLSEDKIKALKVEQIEATPEIVRDTKHKKYFTLDKMDTPVQALKDFLGDIVRKGMGNSEELDKIKSFLEKYNSVNDVETIMNELDEVFPDDFQFSPKFEKAMNSAKHYMNFSGEASSVLLEPGTAFMKIDDIDERVAAQNASIQTSLYSLSDYDEPYVMEEPAPSVFSRY
jgi:hypothetical protein